MSLHFNLMLIDIATDSTQCIYNGPSLKGHFLERTPIYKGHIYLAASIVNIFIIRSTFLAEGCHY